MAFNPRKKNGEESLTGPVIQRHKIPMITKNYRYP